MADIINTLNGVAKADIDKVNNQDREDINTVNGQRIYGNSSIVIDFDGSTTYDSNSPGDVDGYQGIVFSGRQAPDIIDISMTVECTISGTADVTFYYRKNAGSWVSLGNYSSTTGATAKSIPDVDSDDTVDVRINCDASGLGASVSGTATLTGGTFDSGSGTISASGTTTFTLSTSI